MAVPASRVLIIRELAIDGPALNPYHVYARQGRNTRNAGTPRRTRTIVDKVAKGPFSLTGTLAVDRQRTNC